MNGKNNEKNVDKNTTKSVASIKEVKEAQTTLSKKRKIIYWGIAGVVLILSIVLGLMLQKEEPLVLDGLAEFDYSVSQINQHDKTKDYEVRVETEVDEKEDLVELAYEMAQTIRDYEGKEDTRVVVGVYRQPEPGVAVEDVSSEEETTQENVSISKPDLDDENHQITIEITDVIKMYSLLDKSLLEKDINAVGNWEIYGSKRVDEKHLVGSVALQTGATEDDVYRQLKAIESEMVRFNELPKDGATYFDYEREENKLYYGYSSVYPTSLIKIEQLEIVKQEATE